MKNLSFLAFVTSLRIALVFLTTLPVRYPAKVSDQEKRLSVFLYPLAGLCIGLILLVAVLLLPGESVLSAGLVVALWVLLTGALHLDGLTDCADAWVGGLGDRARTLRIMKDPNAGTMGVVALVLVLGLKLLAVIELVGSGHLLFLVAIPVLARLAPAVFFANMEYVRIGGIGSPFRPDTDQRGLLWICIGVVVFIVLLCLGLSGLLLLAVSAGLLWVVGTLSQRRLGGFSGDVAGASIEIIELGCCIVLVLL